VLRYSAVLSGVAVARLAASAVWRFFQFRRPSVIGHRPWRGGRTSGSTPVDHALVDALARQVSACRLSWPPHWTQAALWPKAPPTRVRLSTSFCLCLGEPWKIPQNRRTQVQWCALCAAGHPWRHVLWICHRRWTTTRL